MSVEFYKTDVVYEYTFVTITAVRTYLRYELYRLSIQEFSEQYNIIPNRYCNY